MQAAREWTRVAPIGRHPAPVAHVVRDGIVESVHHGHVVALDADAVAVVAAGDPGVTLLPRSALKPLQAVAMLRAGLDLDGELLALAAASHSGEPFHLAGVDAILRRAGLDAAELRNTPTLPTDVDEAARWRTAGRPAQSRAQNCSGKHAAMLVTCAGRGWDRASYLEPEHPLQRAVRAVVEELTGEPVAHVAVDGCRAPLFSTSLVGLARAYARIAAAPPQTAEGRVAAAMRAHPRWVSGTGRDVVALSAAYPGLLVKDGAEGVLAGAWPDGRAFAVKVLDGSTRPLPVLAAALATALGAGDPDLPLDPAVEAYVGRTYA